MQTEDHVSHEALAERLAAVQRAVDRAFNTGLILFSIAIGGAFGLWREMGAHSTKIEQLERAGGRQESLVDEIHKEITSIRELIAGMRRETK